MSLPVQSYLFDRKISDLRMSLVKSTLGHICFKNSSHTEDVNMATDLVPSIEIGRLAVRVRNNSALKYVGEITMRFGRVTTPSTEFRKICDGNASHMFYAIMNSSGSAFYWWVLVDLNRFRQRIGANPALLNSFTIIPNKDRQSCFMAIPLNLIPDCVVHSSIYLENIMKEKILEAACP